MDTDFHSIMQSDIQEEVVHEILLNPNAPIHIGKHCWICSRCMILKGATLKNNCVLGGAVRFVLYRMMNIVY